MVSVAPRAPTFWAKKETIEVKMSVAEMIRDILKEVVLDAKGRR